MKKRDIIKAVASLTIAVGVSTVVKNMIQATTPVDISPFGRVVVLVGSFALTGVLSGIAAKQAIEQIDEIGEVKDVVIGSIGLIKFMK